MSAQIIIELQGIRFYGEHGMYEEERKVGNEFEVNISLTAKAPKKTVTSINQTINYSEVFRIAKEVFSERKLLLETCAMEIADQLEQQFSQLKSISINIKKLHPPIEGFTGAVSVTYTKTVNK